MHKYTDNYTGKCGELITSVGEKKRQMQREEKYTANNNYEVAIEFSRKPEHKHSTLRTFCRLQTGAYKTARQSSQQSVRIQSTLCEFACKQNSRGLKIDIRKIQSFVIRIMN